MTTLWFHPETGFPYEAPGAALPKPGNNQGTRVPEDFIPHPAKPYHQSLLANEHVAAIAWEAMQIITWE